MPLSLHCESEPNASTSIVDAEPAWAGVSFCFEDAFWCDWLYREFDGLRVPRPLIHRPSKHGLPYPDRLSISPDPADPVQLETYAETLRFAQHLIVVISPTSGRSELIQEQMRAFRAAGGEERIVALVVKGEPASPMAEPASLDDREWMPQWLNWRLSEAGFATADRTEPFVVDARMGVATLGEVRAQLLAAMLEVPEEQLSELGIVPRPSTRPSITSDTVQAALALPMCENAEQPQIKSRKWETISILIAAGFVVTGAVFWKLGLPPSTVNASSTQRSASVKRLDPDQSAWKPGEPVVAVSVVPSSDTPAKPPISASSVNPETDTREFRTLLERRDRLFFLAETRMKKGDNEESHAILKQAADIAGDAIRKSESAPEHLLRAAEIQQRLGLLSSRIASPADARKCFENARQLIQQIRTKSPAFEDGAQLLADIEIGLKQIAAP